MDLAILKTEVSNRLLSKGVARDDIKDIETLFSETSVSGNPFVKVKTGHLLQTFICDNFNFVVRFSVTLHKKKFEANFAKY